MANHFHLVVEPPQANLIGGMKWFLGTYTSRFNRRHKIFGHLFSGRCRSLIVDSKGYLRTVCDYVLNPAWAKLLWPEERLREETTMTVAWIAERLKMGTKRHLA